MLQQTSTKVKNTWAIVYSAAADRYRAVIDSEATRERNLYGCDILHRGLSAYDANMFLNGYRNAVVVDLSDCLFWDTDVSNEDEISEYDTINVACLDGIWRVGQVIAWDDTDVVIEVGSTLYLADKSTAELIAKIEDGDWTTEYEEWLDELSTQAGVVA